MVNYWYIKYLWLFPMYCRPYFICLIFSFVLRLHRSPSSEDLHSTVINSFIVLLLPYPSVHSAHSTLICWKEELTESPPAVPYIRAIFVSWFAILCFECILLGWFFLSSWSIYNMSTFLNETISSFMAWSLPFYRVVFVSDGDFWLKFYLQNDSLNDSMCIRWSFESSETYRLFYFRKTQQSVYYLF